MLTILLLEDDPIIADILREYLEGKGYGVAYAYDIGEVYDHIDRSSFDLYLFDVNVPGGNGYELLGDIRRSGDRTPTIFITARGGIGDMKEGFASGCDDYIRKPFELDELELRIENIKRIYRLDTLVRIDETLSLDRENLALIVDGEARTIREKEFAILEYLARHSGRVVSHEELTRNVWAYEEHPGDATLRTYIKNLRRLVGAERIETVKGVGYRFVNA